MQHLDMLLQHPDETNETFGTLYLKHTCITIATCATSTRSTFATSM
jgi:hypothetical protein